MKTTITTIFASLCMFLTIAQQDAGRGLIPPTQEEYQSNITLQSTYIGQGENIYKRTKSAYGDASASSFDLRDINGVSSVKSQGTCGSCWAFAAVSSLESSNLLINGEESDLSEQQLVNCSPNGSCGGGFYDTVYNWMLTNDTGIANETDLPYEAVQNSCSLTNPKGLKIANWSNLGLFSDIDDVKEAIVTHGAVATALFTKTPAFNNLKPGEVIYGYENEEIDHAVVIVGWDDSKGAWLIKNSWGDWWADKGYGWVGYNSCAIGYFSWVDVVKKDSELEPIDDKNKDLVVIDFVDVLGNTQLHQELYIKIDDEDPKIFGMNKQGVKYHNRVAIEKGTHKFEIISKSIISKNNKKSMIFGLSKGNIEVKKNEAYKLVYTERIKKSSVFRMELKPDDIKIK